MDRRKWWFLAAVGMLFMVLGALVLLEDSVQIEQKSAAEYVPLISIAEVKSQDHRGRVQSYATVQPRWSVTLKSQVNGEIVEVSKLALAGQFIKKGDLLIRIENSAYLVAVREAERAVSSAQIDLTREVAKTERAPREWKSSGIKGPPTALALNLPQLDLVQKSLRVAQSQLDAARNKLAYTSIFAPFSGVVMARNVSTGESVSEGYDLLKIVGSKHQDIAVALSKRQWGMLAKDWKNGTAIIHNQAGAEIAQAYMKRGGGVLDQKTRQYRLFLEVIKAPATKILVGDYVRVSLPGSIAHASLAVPQSALTREGLIWYVDDDSRLRSFIANIIFYSDHQIIIATPSRKSLSRHYPAKWRIATTPLASFLAGNRVQGKAARGQ